MYSIRLTTVLLGALTSMAIGFVWYGPLFGNEWRKLVGIKKKDFKKYKKKMNKIYVMSFFTSFILSFFTGLLVRGMKADNVISGAMTGFMIWLGFIFTTHFVHYIYEGKKLKLFKINMGYHLVELMSLGALFALII